MPQLSSATSWQRENSISVSLFSDPYLFIIIFFLHSYSRTIDWWPDRTQCPNYAKWYIFHFDVETKLYPLHSNRFWAKQKKMISSTNKKMKVIKSIQSYWLGPSDSRVNKTRIILICGKLSMIWFEKLWQHRKVYWGSTVLTFFINYKFVSIVKKSPNIAFLSHGIINSCPQTRNKKNMG